MLCFLAPFPLHYYYYLFIFIIAALIAAFISAHCGCTHLTVRMLSPVLTVIIASHTAWHRELAWPCGRPEVRGRARVKICCGNRLAMQQLATAETPAVCCRKGRREGGMVLSRIKIAHSSNHNATLEITQLWGCFSCRSSQTVLLSSLPSVIHLSPTGSASMLFT